MVTKLEFNCAILDENVLISRSTLQDISSLEAISEKSKWNTRYYNDENFLRDRLKKFYSEWVKKSVSGDLDHMVFHIKEVETIVGFVYLGTAQGRQKSLPELASTDFFEPWSSINS